jgi:hypothetical protein
MREYADLQLRIEPKNLRIEAKNLRISNMRTFKKTGSPTILRTRSALGVNRHVSNFRFLCHLVCTFTSYTLLEKPTVLTQVGTRTP